jgi:hypothetical protein
MELYAIILPSFKGGGNVFCARRCGRVRFDVRDYGRAGERVASMLLTLTEMVFIGTKSPSRQLAAIFGAFTLVAPCMMALCAANALAATCSNRSLESTSVAVDVTYDLGHVSSAPRADLSTTVSVRLGRDECTRGSYALFGERLTVLPCFSL